MGTWNTSSFGNDDAQGWLADLAKSDYPDLIEDILSAITEADDYVEAPEAQQAMAAAEVVAAMHGKPADGLPDEAEEWAGRKGQPSIHLVGLARRAVERVRSDSELTELWEDEGSGEWEAMVEDLSARLVR